MCVCVWVCLYPFRSVLITDLFMKTASQNRWRLLAIYPNRTLKSARQISEQHQPVKYGLLEELHPVPVGLGLKV